VKVAEAIAAYLSAQRLRGLEPSSVRTTGHALRTVLAPVLVDEVASLAAVGIEASLQDALAQRRSQTSGRLLSPTTRELYLNASKAFLAWCTQRGWIPRNPLEGVPARPSEAPTVPAVPHIGDLIRNLREAAGLTRQQLAAQTGVQDGAIRAVEMGRHRLSRGIYDRLMRSPALARLPQLAKNAGIPLPTEESGPEDGGEPSRGKP
jgi:hypothetical protein